MAIPEVEKAHFNDAGYTAVFNTNDILKQTHF
jgi:hypothetical protein